MKFYVSVIDFSGINVDMVQLKKKKQWGFGTYFCMCSDLTTREVSVSTFPPASALEEL